jgi:hypothetical protein
MEGCVMPGTSISQPPHSGDFRKGNKGGGRKVGSKALISRKVLTDIIKAYEKLGGVKWLVEMARKDPKTFAQLYGRVLPREIKVEQSVEIKMPEWVGKLMDSRYGAREAIVAAEGRVIGEDAALPDPEPADVVAIVPVTEGE